MDAIISTNNVSGNKNYRHQLKIDMTPMVDLGFLLITFFIFTSSIAEPVATNLFMPKDGSKTNLSDSAALTVLLAGENTIYYYEGKWDNNFSNKNMLSTTYNLSAGLGNVIRNKQKRMGSRKNELMILIKPSDESTYNNLINTLHETMINAVKKFAVIDLSAEEKSFLKQ